MTIYKVIATYKTEFDEEADSQEEAIERVREYFNDAVGDEPTIITAIPIGT